MIITLKGEITAEQYNSLLDRIKDRGLEPKIDTGTSKTVIGLRGDTTGIETGYFMVDGVENVSRVSKPYKLVSREFLHPDDSIIDVSGVKIGGGHFAVIAGPCSVESEEQLFAAAKAVKESGAQLLRGGAYKPRSSPYTFQGLGEKGLEILARARDKFHLPIVTEILDTRDIELFEKYDIDMYQVGARNMGNTALLKALGTVKKPVLFKRGPSATIEEWLTSAEYLPVYGNPNIVFCERGVNGPERDAFRNTLDLNAVEGVHEASHLPIIVDPSHGTGRLSMVEPMGCAAVLAGADGLMIEVHPDRNKALSDANQQLSPEEFSALMAKIEKLRKAL